MLSPKLWEWFFFFFLQLLFTNFHLLVATQIEMSFALSRWAWTTALVVRRQYLDHYAVELGKRSDFLRRYCKVWDWNIQLLHPTIVLNYCTYCCKLENRELNYILTALHCTALHFTALYRTALRCTALHCTALRCTALRCPALNYTTLHCTELHHTFLQHGKAWHVGRPVL